MVDLRCVLLVSYMAISAAQYFGARPMIRPMAMPMGVRQAAAWPNRWPRPQVQVQQRVHPAPTYPREAYEACIAEGRLVRGATFGGVATVDPKCLQEKGGAVAGSGVACANTSYVAGLVSGPGYPTYLNKPTAANFNPKKPHELWVVNDATDSVSVLEVKGRLLSSVSVYDTNTDGYFLQDAFAEHFMEHPMAIAFNPDTDKFATIGDSMNCVRDMTFVSSPERNTNFKCNGFTGPALWDTETFARVRQDKPYMGDWLAPGGGRDPSHAVPECRAQQPEPDVCHSEGSHEDMLHETPYGMGIAHYKLNQYFVFDGAGGHLIFYDFNKDHKAGNTFHSDGRAMRYLDVQLARLEGVHSGMVFDADKRNLFIADTANGRVLRVAMNTGTYYEWLPSYYPEFSGWKDMEGVGDVRVYDKDYGFVALGPEPGGKEVDEWYKNHRNESSILKTMELGKEGGFPGDYIAPMETLATYGAMLGAEQEVVIDTERHGISAPSGLTFLADGRLAIGDYATGHIHIMRSDGSEWKTDEELDTSTGANALMGLTVRASHPNKLYFVNNKASTVGEIVLAC